MEVIGYKAFNKGLVNRYGFKLEVGKIYQVEGDVSWGNNGNGFHLCLNLEDCFRYFDGDIDIALVKGSGKMSLYNDEYYGYYDMYVCEKMEILKVLTREEVTDHILQKPITSQARFLRSDYSKTERDSFSKEAKVYEIRY